MTHVHKYQRVRLNRSIIGRQNYFVYRCMLPNCPHYVPEALVVNRASICNRCGGEFIITLKESKMKKPHCKDCTYSKERVA